MPTSHLPSRSRGRCAAFLPQGHREQVRRSGKTALVAELGPVRARQWVPSSELTDLWHAPPDPTLGEDLARLGGELADPWAAQRVAVLLDTSVLIAAETGPEEDAAISVVSLTELHLGVLIAADDRTRALRLRRLAVIEDHFDALPFDAAAALECGRLHAVLAKRGGRPRRRAFDLAIAATANVHGVPLLTCNTRDFELLAGEIDILSPQRRPRLSARQPWLRCVRPAMLQGADRRGAAGRTQRDPRMRDGVRAVH